jgi:cell wall-associated NlpC family hydrolase
MVMTTYSAEEIYGFARAAGFTPDQATTMTAIALAESGGNVDAHATTGEDSRGLWQINMAAHQATFGSVDLYDPVSNAKAAYEVSNHGHDISPWTVTHHGGDARYLTFEAQAHAAAAAYGDPSNLGVWTGTEGYGHPVAAGDDGDLGGQHSLTFDLTDDAPTHDDPGPDHDDGNGDHDGVRSAGDFLHHALAQDGDSYVFGHEVALNDADPNTFDCSELVQWAAHQAGVDVPDGSWLQYAQAHQMGTTMSVEQALHTPGALLFSFSSDPLAGTGRPEKAHVAISLGDGRTIEANGPKTGVGMFDAGINGSRFQYAATIPGMDYADVHAIDPDKLIEDALQPKDISVGPVVDTTPPVVDHDPPAPAPLDPNSPDTDSDGLTDAIEARLGTNANEVDSDHDGVSDAYEVAQLHTDATRADTDFDGLSDSIELALGLDPTLRDTDGDGHIDSAGYFADGPDTDGDHLSDALEAILGTSLDRIDSDGDGFSDSLEFDAGTDPLNADLHPGLQAGGATAGDGDLQVVHGGLGLQVDTHRDLALQLDDDDGDTDDDTNGFDDDT